MFKVLRVDSTIKNIYGVLFWRNGGCLKMAMMTQEIIIFDQNFPFCGP